MEHYGHYLLLGLDKLGRVSSRAQHNIADEKLIESRTHYDEAGRVYSIERWARKADLTADLAGGSGWQETSIWLDEEGAVLERSGDICGCSAYTYVYDALGRQVTYKDALSASEQNLVLYEYDDDSRVTKTVRKDKSQNTGVHGHQDLTTESTYDARGNLVTSSRIVDVSTSYDTIYSYGDRDQLTKVTDPEGRVANYDYNEQLWRTKVTLEAVGDDVITEYTFDEGGGVLTRRAKNAAGGDQDTVYTYDNLGRIVTTEWADGEKTINTYDLAGNKVSTTQRNGTVLERSYDKNNRLTTLDVTLAAGVVGPTSVTYAYDGAGRITKASTEEESGYTSVVERTYNTLGKIEAETQVIDGWNSGNGRTITYTWNVKGQKTATEYPVSGDDITYDRDDLDRIDKISLNTEEVADYTYLGSRVIKKEFPGSYDQRSYDAVGRLTTIHHKDTSSGNTLAKFEYELDDGDMIIEWDRFYYDDVENTRILDNTHDEGSQFAYDGAGRLVTALRGVPTAEMGDSLATNLTDGDYDEKVEWIYDQVGNRLTQKVDAVVDQDAAYDKINALTTLNATTRNYDDNGNFDPTTYATYSYDYRNQIGKMSLHSISRVYTWHHDAFGRTIERVLGSNQSNFRTYFDGNHIVERVSFDDTPDPDTETQTREFVFGAGLDELLLHIPTDVDPDDRWYAHADQVSSVHFLADDSGSIGESYRYEEFGEPALLDGSFVVKSSPKSLLKNPFRYTGRPYASAAKWSGEQWYDLRARHYSSSTGRFNQQDPLGFADGSSRYSYARRDPIRLRDPLGLLTLLNGGVAIPPGPPVEQEEDSEFDDDDRAPAPCWTPLNGPESQGEGGAGAGNGGLPQAPSDGKTGPMCNTCACTRSGCNKIAGFWSKTGFGGILPGIGLYGTNVVITCGKTTDPYGAESCASAKVTSPDGGESFGSATITMNLAMFVDGDCENPPLTMEQTFFHELGHVLDWRNTYLGQSAVSQYVYAKWERTANAYANCLSQYSEDAKGSLQLAGFYSKETPVPDDWIPEGGCQQ